MSERRAKTESELVEYVRAIDASAPAALHERVQALVAERAGTGADWRARARGGLLGTLVTRPARAGGLASALAAVGVALALALASGGASAPSVQAASAPTLADATMAAPGESHSDGRQLTVGVEGVAFPYWGESFGWNSVGERTDRIGGRGVTTVFYENGRGRRIGYAILAGTAPRVSGGVVAWRGGTAFHQMKLNGAAAVVWMRNGRLCIVSGRGVDEATLVRLASWDERASVAS